MENTNINEVPKSQEEIAFEDMNTGLDTIRATREKMIEQLGQITASTKIDFEGDAPRKTEMKLSLFKTVDDLLRSQENLLTGKVKMSLAKKSEASSDSLKLMAVEILRKIDMNQRKNSAAPVAITETDVAALNQAFDQMKADDPNAIIKDAELVMDEQPATA